MRTACPQTIDPSMGSALDNCPRAFYWSFIREIIPSSTPDYFISGRAWDDAQGALWSPGLLGNRIENAYKALQDCYAEESQGVIFREARTLENLEKLLDLYINEHDLVSPLYKTIDTNIGFTFPYKDFFLAGELDMYIEYPPIGTLVKENKTTLLVPLSGRSWDRYLQSFSLGSYANQLRHYEWAVSQLTECAGSLVEVSCLSIPKRASTVRTQFYRKIASLSLYDIAEYLALCEDRMKRLRHYWKVSHWPRQGQHCTGAYGLQPCVYLPLCSANIHEATSDDVIPTNMYSIGLPWAPWNGIKRSLEKGEKS